MFLTPSKQMVVTPPESDPIDLIDVKERLTISSDDDDADLQLLIEEGAAECELKTGIALITQTRMVAYDCFPSNDILPLRGGPIQYIKTVTIHRADNTSEVIYRHDPNDTDNDIGTDKYYLTDANRNGALTLKYQEKWRTDILQPREGIVIEYVCGFGESADDIPSALRGGIMAYVKHYYNMEDTEEPLPSSVMRPWNRYAIVNI